MSKFIRIPPFTACHVFTLNSNSVIAAEDRGKDRLNNTTALTMTCTLCQNNLKTFGEGVSVYWCFTAIIYSILQLYQIANRIHSSQLREWWGWFNGRWFEICSMQTLFGSVFLFCVLRQKGFFEPISAFSSTWPRTLTSPVDRVICGCYMIVMSGLGCHSDVAAIVAVNEV